MNIKISAKPEVKQHKPWFDDECLGFLDQRKQAKMQWVQDPNHSYVDNVNNLRHEPSRHCMHKKKEYLAAKIDELENNSKIKISETCIRAPMIFKKGYQPRTNIVRDEKHDLVTNSHSILARWRNHTFQLCHVSDCCMLSSGLFPGV